MASVSGPRDPIGEYLSDLRRRLELAPDEAALVVTEAEDHLRETEACGLAAGMTGHEAQLAAISAFGANKTIEISWCACRWASNMARFCCPKG